MDCVRVWYRDASPMKASSNFFPMAGHADLSYVVNRFLILQRPLLTNLFPCVFMVKNT